MKDVNETTLLPDVFNIVRVFLTDGSGHEAVWTGTEWWLRHGAVLMKQQCERWEIISPSVDGIFHPRYELPAT
jgi:hypothetical protein